MPGTKVRKSKLNFRLIASLKLIYFTTQHNVIYNTKKGEFHAINVLKLKIDELLKLNFYYIERGSRRSHGRFGE